MPTYCYERPNGEIVEKVFLMGEAPECINIVFGHFLEYCTRSWATEMAGGAAFVKRTSNPVKRAWPMAPCVASGVHPDQAQELRDHLSDRGCPTEVSNEGGPVYMSAAHRRKALKIRGYIDKASYC